MTMNTILSMFIINNKTIGYIWSRCWNDQNVLNGNIAAIIYSNKSGSFRKICLAYIRVHIIIVSCKRRENDVQYVRI